MAIVPEAVTPQISHRHVDDNTTHLYMINPCMIDQHRVKRAQ